MPSTRTIMFVEQDDLQRTHLVIREHPNWNWAVCGEEVAWARVELYETRGRPADLRVEAARVCPACALGLARALNPEEAP